MVVTFAQLRKFATLFTALSRFENCQNVKMRGARQNESSQTLLATTDGGCDMILAKIILLLLVVHALGCAGRLSRHEESQTSADEERQEQKKESAMPTFTYRPGS